MTRQVRLSTDRAFARATIRALACVVPCAALLPAATTRAYEGQASLDVAGGYLGIAKPDALPAHTATLSLGGSLGLGDMFALRAAGGYGLEVEHGHSFGHGLAELVYLVDVLEIVPFFGLGGGVLGGPQASVAPLGFGVVGFDYLASRAWFTGLDVRVGITDDDGQQRAFTQVTLRCGLLFDLE